MITNNRLLDMLDEFQAGSNNPDDAFRLAAILRLLVTRLPAPEPATEKPRGEVVPTIYPEELDERTINWLADQAQGFVECGDIDPDASGDIQMLVNVAAALRWLAKDRSAKIKNKWGVAVTRYVVVNLHRHSKQYEMTSYAAKPYALSHLRVDSEASECRLREVHVCPETGRIIDITEDSHAE